MLAWLLKPSNLIIVALGVMLALTWAGYQTKKVQLAECRGELSVCQRDVAGFQAEMASANSIIEGLRRNLANIKKQLGEWQQIARDAEDYAQRLLKAAEAKVDCEVYNAENARLVDEFVDSFNAYSVRRKVNGAGSAGDRGSAEVLPKASETNAGAGDKR